MRHDHSIDQERSPHQKTDGHATRELVQASFHQRRRTRLRWLRCSSGVGRRCHWTHVTIDATIRGAPRRIGMLPYATSKSLRAAAWPLTCANVDLEALGCVSGRRAGRPCPSGRRSLAPQRRLHSLSHTGSASAFTAGLNPRACPRPRATSAPSRADRMSHTFWTARAMP